MKSTSLTTNNWRLLAFCAAFMASLANCDQKIDFELTGKVLDKQTKEPIAGAYVMASYRTVRADAAAIANWCVKTRGMYTDGGGNYHFPVEKRDGYSPFSVCAIKPDYTLCEAVKPDPELWKKQNAQAYTGRIIYLTKQNPSKPDLRFSYGDEICDHAPSREDAAAGVEFMKIQQREKAKYGASREALDAGQEIIHELEGLPTASSAASRSKGP